MATKAELSRLWERVESIREDLGSLADEIAELYGAEEGDDLEAVLERSEPCGFCLRAMQKLIYEERDKITRKEYYGSIENKKRLP